MICFLDTLFSTLGLFIGLSFLLILLIVEIAIFYNGIVALLLCVLRERDMQDDRLLVICECGLV